MQFTVFGYKISEIDHFAKVLYQNLFLLIARIKCLLQLHIQYTLHYFDRTQFNQAAFRLWLTDSLSVSFLTVENC